MTQDDPMKDFRRWWPRVVARAKGGWDRRFADNIADMLEVEDWTPTDAQIKTMVSMCEAYDADEPEYGERLVLPDGRVKEWCGFDGWLEVRW